ncbi:hypothetical protein, partial [Bordetella bronchiseptica]|uniref:hypothetical protein n=1 Tax=Bordetella bronchiseptica TaxID=518 RepID=UPI001C0F38BD
VYQFRHLGFAACRRCRCVRSSKEANYAHFFAVVQVGLKKSRPAVLWHTAPTRRLVFAAMRFPCPVPYARAARGPDPIACAR